MAVQFNVTTRNAILDAIETAGGSTACLELRSGTLPGSCSAATTDGLVLVTINLPADWMSNAASGSKAKLGVWSDPTADNSGLATFFRTYTSTTTKDNTTCFMQGTVGQGTGDLSLDNATLVAGQAVTINAFTIAAANG